MPMPEALRHSIRLTGRHPGFAVLVVAIFGIAIGAMTAAVSVGAGVLLTPLPVKDGAGLVVVTKSVSGGSTVVPFSPAEMTAWNEGVRSLDGNAGVQYDGAWPWPAQFGGRAVTVNGTVVSGNFFTVLGAEPVAGRLLVTGDGKPGAEDVAVIGYGLWQRHFGGDPRVSGRRVRINSRPVTIVGVAPARFAFPSGAEVWQPLVVGPAAMNEGWFRLVARLKPDSTLPNYFSTMGIPIVQGRVFAQSDRKGSLPVTMISNSLARHAWPGSSALGKRLKFGGPGSPAPWMTVIAIVGDLRYRDLRAPPPAIYVPTRQSEFPARFLIVRAHVEDAPVLTMTQRVLEEIDPAQSVSEVASVSALLTRELAGPRFQMSALVLFAGVAVLLAAVGVLAVSSAFVAQRSREMALRVALGAGVSDVRKLVLLNVGRPAAAGLLAGTVTALATTRLVRPLLFQLSALDAPAFAAGWVVLLLASLLAALGPLQRVGRADPITLLRAE